MTALWVDTDFGFDDLWALLVLRHYGIDIAGVSLVAGNAPLAQVAANASGAMAAYGFDWPVWQGASRPLVRTPETAERILGPTGMRTRGRALDPSAAPLPEGAIDALCDWLRADPDAPHGLLALGPLTNIAQLIDTAPELARRITRLVWMGGSAGPGNHTPLAEYNAVADAEALAHVVAFGVPLDIVDLTFCRQITFGPNDMPDADPLTHDLLGGYLDIALERGRPGMAIYDPLAALALTHPGSITFTPCHVAVSTAGDETYGATEITHLDSGQTRICTAATQDLATLCLYALRKAPPHGSR